MEEELQAVQQGDILLLPNGYCGTVRYIDTESHRYGVELTEPFINGNDGRANFNVNHGMDSSPQVMHQS